MKKCLIVWVFVLCCFTFGCETKDDHKDINKCLFRQDGEICELKQRIKELEWKVKSLRYDQEQQFNKYKEMAEEHLKDKK